MLRYILGMIIGSLLLTSCSQEKVNTDSAQDGTQKIGVLLVSHGSHSAAWRKMLFAVEDSVKSEIMKNKSVQDIRSAYMEYNEPSIATRMKEFDEEGYTDVVIVPLFLTVSAHSFDDIPTIVGLKSSQSEIEKLKQERIEVYKSKANIKITPLLDFTEILGKNLANRVKQLSENPAEEGCILVAYGDEEYNKEWTALMNKMASVIEVETGINEFSHSWCGHIVHYETEPTTSAINSVLDKKKNAIVMPVLVAIDEMFQGQIIGDAIDKTNKKSRIKYKPDSILPDKNLEQWVIEITNSYVNDIAKK
ncbi:MAG: CbiX/SirB N-terminal domain-containing protein [Candidatus Kapaibacterium sp.]